MYIINQCKYQGERYIEYNDHGIDMNEYLQQGELYGMFPWTWALL
jgi:hypothetical protein